MITVFPGWYIKVVRKSFLSKLWKVTLYDGFKVGLSSPYMLKSDAEKFAQGIFNHVCKDYLERIRQEQPEVFAKILHESDTKWLWRTEAMGKISIGKIARILYSNEINH